jgi:hypothetical protein
MSGRGMKRPLLCLKICHVLFHTNPTIRRCMTWRLTTHGPVSFSWHSHLTELRAVRWFLMAPTEAWISPMPGQFGRWALRPDNQATRIKRNAAVGLGKALALMWVKTKWVRGARDNTCATVAVRSACVCWYETRPMLLQGAVGRDTAHT